MFIDRKGKLWGRISIVDIFIVSIILIGSFLFVSTYKDSLFSNTENKDKVNIAIIATVPDVFTEYFKIGEDVKFQDDENAFGKILEVTFEDSDFYGYNSKGESVLSPQPGYKDIKILLEATGKYNQGKFSFDNKELFPAKRIPLVTGRVIIYAQIQSISRVQ